MDGKATAGKLRRVSLLAEVAARADVPVEGVIRVVTRQPVSRRIEQRVVDVLDRLEPEQLRVLERLARAGMPEIVVDTNAAPRGDDTPATHTNDLSTALGADELTLRLGHLFQEVVTCLNEMRQDHVADRQARVDDLAVLVELVTTGWQGVDRRLARLERSLARLEALRETPTRRVLETPQAERRPDAQSVPQARPPHDGAAVASAEAAVASAEAGAAEAGPPFRPRRRLWRWVVPAVPILLVTGLAVAIVAVEFFPSAADEPRLRPALEQNPGRLDLPQTSVSATTGGAFPLAETATPTQPLTATAPPPEQPGTAVDTTPFPTNEGAAAPALAWPALPGARYYLVRIFRRNQLVHAARPRVARLVLPASIELTPGTYRWSVRAGIGAPADNRLGQTIVDSTFNVRR